jgi:hypothetical protein
MSGKTIGCVVLLLLASSAVSAVAESEATAIAAGGLVARGETRIVMAKEQLLIRPDKIVVDYDFRNDTNEDVTTEVAFPVPLYKDEAPQVSGSDQSFGGLQVWVGGKPQAYKIEIRATLGDDDVTGILTDDQIDIPSFGHHEGRTDSSGAFRETMRDFERLPADEQDHLVRLGLFEKDGQSAGALWTVHIQYYWAQRFPAHSTVHVRQEYAPVTGLAYIENADQVFTSLLTGKTYMSELGVEAGAENTAALARFCPDRAWMTAAVSRYRALRKDTHGNADWEDALFQPRWVDFLLTSANSWRVPIEDFTLIVDRGKAVGTDWEFTTGISFCAPPDSKSDQKIEKLSDGRYRLHIDNLVPASELHIGFFDLPAAEPPAR